MKKMLLILLFSLGVLGNEIEVLSTKSKGVVGENLLIKGLEKTGWKCVNGEWNNVNGIDALCFKKDKNGNIKDVLIGESKYNKSNLNCNLNNGKVCQMSKEWIIDRLKKLSQQCVNKPNLRCPTKEELDQILQHVRKNNYRGRLFKIFPSTEGLKVEILKIPSGINSNELKAMKDNFPKIHNTIFSKQDNTINIKTPKTNLDIEASQIVKNEIKNSSSKIATNSSKIKIPPLKEVSIGTKLSGGAKGIGASLMSNVIGKLRFTNSILKQLPIIGIAAQVAWDTYVGYKLDELDERVTQNTKAIEINTQNIQENRNLINQNRAYIERIVQEQKILKESIANNTYRINQLYAYTFAINQNVEAISTELSYIKTKVASLETSINQNKLEIAKIKKGIFTTGIDMWNMYLKTNDETYLVNAIDNFIKSIKVDSNNSFAYFYLTLAYAKKATLHNREEEKKLALENYKKFVNHSDNIKYILAAGLIISAIDNKFNTEAKKILYKKFENKINTLIKKGLFDEAVEIGGGYYAISKDNTLYKFALEKRENNYLKYKNFKDKQNLFYIINKFHNTLLNEAAIRYLYKYDYYEDALWVLKNKRIENDNFRLKAYLAIFKILGDKEKVEKLKRLILTNPTYDKKLKEFVKKI